MRPSKPIKGIYVPLVTPFDASGELAPGKALPLIEKHLEIGVQGFYIGGSSGEGFLQSVSERSEYLKFVAEANDKRGTLIAQVGAISSRDAWTLAEHAADYGYDVVSSTPPFYYNYTEHEVVEYYRELSERSPLPVMLYNTPGTTGKNLSIGTQIELLELPNVMGSKHTDLNFFTAERLMQAVEGTQVINGPDELLTAGLAIGMCGGIGSTYNLMPRYYLDIYRFVSSGELHKAREVQAKANRVISELLSISPGVVPGIKLGLKMLGYDVGLARKPFRPVQGDVARFQRLLKECDSV